MQAIIVGPLGVELRRDTSPGEWFRARVRAGLCGVCGTPRVNMSRCAECAEEHRQEERVK